MKKILPCVLTAFVLSSCLEKEEENLTPPAKPEAVSYSIIVPNFTTGDGNIGSAIQIKATQCKTLYYDKQLIRVNCYADGDWIRKDNDWEYKGKNLVFAGLVRAYYLGNSQTQKP